jgi:putative peptide zinc metalloprotease protein
MVVLIPKRLPDRIIALPLPAPVAPLLPMPVVDPLPPAPEPPAPQPVAAAAPPDPPAPAPAAQESSWVFPFAPPPAPRPGDSQALAVNTVDNSSKYEVALSLVWVTDGSPVDQRNTAYAAASCANCTTVAVTFQAIFVIGRAEVITPVNDAVAVNYNCTTCITSAIAVQLAATLAKQPTAAALQEISSVWTQLQQQSSNLVQQPATTIYADLRATRSQLLTILAGDGDLPTTTTPAQPPTTTPTTPTTTTATTTTAQTTPTTTTATTTTATTTTATTTAATTTTATTTTATTTTATTTTATTTTTTPTTTTTTTP